MQGSQTKSRDLYLSYVNDFLTVERFAEHHEMTVEQALQVIDYERRNDKNYRSSSYDSTLALFPSYRHHHLPVWLKKRIRQTALTRGDWEANTNPDSYIHKHANSTRGFAGMWDHYGSIIVDGQRERAMILQPYGTYENAAVFFAEYGIDCAVKQESPYHKNACLITLTHRDDAE